MLDPWVDVRAATREASIATEDIVSPSLVKLLSSVRSIDVAEMLDSCTDVIAAVRDEASF